MYTHTNTHIYVYTHTHTHTQTHTHTYVFVCVYILYKTVVVHTFVLTDDGPVRLEACGSWCFIILL